MNTLNIMEMLWSAGPMVKFVMFLLIAFSLISWTIVFMKARMFRQATKESELFLESFWKSKNLADANKQAQELTATPLAEIFRKGYLELQKLGRTRASKDVGSETLETRIAGMDNLQRTMGKAIDMEIKRLSRHLSFLATTGSATPFIGLFGTVWGIMSSFHQIGLQGAASLAVVAPGISEALVATAAGLAVAIPAVLFYNYFSSRLAELESEMQGFSTDFLNLVERDLLARLP